MSDKTVVINRSSRTFELRSGPDGQPRRLVAGASIETLDDKEAKQLLSYSRDIVDASKVVPQNAAKITAMQAEIDRLKAENAKLLDTIDPEATAKADADAKAKAAADAKSKAEDDAKAKKGK